MVEMSTVFLKVKTSRNMKSEKMSNREIAEKRFIYSCRSGYKYVSPKKHGIHEKHAEQTAKK